MKMRSRRAAYATAGLALLLSGSFEGCVSHPDTDDSETHFLVLCDGACSDGLQCLCGVCTRLCADATACPKVPGAVCEASCGESQSSVCDVRCAQDHDCNALGATFGCNDGRCRAVPSPATSAKDGGPSGAADANVVDVVPDASRVDGSDGSDGSSGVVELPSCRGLPASCGPNRDENCCSNPLVEGGTFDRGLFTGLRDQLVPVTVSSFRLDKFEVTVGRFRKFVEAYTGGWRPEPGSGKHAHLNGGKGLQQYPAVENGIDFEAGWVDPHKGLYSEWVWPLPGTHAAWNARLLSWTGCDVYDDGGWFAGAVACEFCDPGGSVPCFQTWTPEPGENELRPISQAQWIEAYAFCIWDGGFLPSESELQYAIAGGAENRPYPWGSEVPGPDAKLHINGCYYDDRPDRPPGGQFTECTGIHNIAAVGSVPAGNGRWGHADLAGNVQEWVMDAGLNTLPPSCTDCAFFSECGPACDQGRSCQAGADFSRGGGYTIQHMTTNGGGDDARGFRCARSP